MRVARAFNTDIDFPVIITTVPPCAQPSIDPVLSQQIYGALTNYLVSRVSAELANDDTAEEETEPGMGRVVSDRSGVQGSAGKFSLRWRIDGLHACDVMVAMLVYRNNKFFSPLGLSFHFCAYSMNKFSFVLYTNMAEMQSTDSPFYSCVLCDLVLDWKRG